MSRPAPGAVVPRTSRRWSTSCGIAVLVDAPAKRSSPSRPSASITLVRHSDGSSNSSVVTRSTVACEVTGHSYPNCRGLHVGSWTRHGRGADRPADWHPCPRPSPCMTSDVPNRWCTARVVGSAPIDGARSTTASVRSASTPRFPSGPDRPGRLGRSICPTIVIDVRPSVDDPVMLLETAARLASSGYGALLGEHLDDPAPERPHIAAGVVAAQGVAVVATITPRDRSEPECSAEVDALVAAGVRAIHCVTGDHPACRFGPDLTATFSMDGTRLAALARSRGAFVTVAESPGQPARRVAARTGAVQAARRCRRGHPEPRRFGRRPVPVRATVPRRRCHDAAGRPRSGGHRSPFRTR